MNKNNLVNIIFYVAKLQNKIIIYVNVNKTGEASFSWTSQHKLEFNRRKRNSESKDEIY